MVLEIQKTTYTLSFVKGTPVFDKYLISYKGLKDMSKGLKYAQGSLSTLC